MNQSLSINLQKEINMTDCDCEISGQFVATCSTEGSILIFKIVKEEEKVLQIITINDAHKSAIWRVRWADKRFGYILASCGFDKKLKIWEMKRKSLKNSFEYKKIHEEEFKSSVNCIDWAPWIIGKRVACADSQGQVSILNFTGQKWELEDALQVSKEPVNAIMWEPCFFKGKSDQNKTYYLAAAGCSGELIILGYKVSNDGDDKDNIGICWKIQAHNDWIRDLSWAHNSYMNYWLIATGSEDKKCKIWKMESGKKDDYYRDCFEIVTDSPVWRVSWNPTGNLLCVVYTNKEGHNTNKVYAEDQRGQWKEISDEKHK